MNIIVKPYGSDRCCCRPDTTWERENKDFYSPECVNEIYWTPIVFARISKAGKCIGSKFASRYYDAIGFGILLYLGDGEIAFSSCADHTSVLPFPLYNPVVSENADNVFEVKRNGESLFSVQMADIDCKSLIESAICTASGLTSIRIGDFTAVELGSGRLLAERNDREIKVEASFCENSLFDFKVIF